MLTIFLIAFLKGKLTQFNLSGILVLSLIALVYTTPWDNYLIFRGVWTYPPDAVVGKLGYVPLEEYGFMILQTWLAGVLFAQPDLLLLDEPTAGVDPQARRDQTIDRAGAQHVVVEDLAKAVPLGADGVEEAARAGAARLDDAPAHRIVALGGGIAAEAALAAGAPSHVAPIKARAEEAAGEDRSKKLIEAGGGQHTYPTYAVSAG